MPTNTHRVPRDLIAARARETPSAIAVVDVNDDGDSLHFYTFSQLDARVDALSRAIRSTTTPMPTRRVGSLARGGIDAVVALFARARAFAASSSLSPRAIPAPSPVRSRRCSCVFCALKSPARNCSAFRCRFEVRRGETHSGKHHVGFTGVSRVERDV